MEVTRITAASTKARPVVAKTALVTEAVVVPLMATAHRVALPIARGTMWLPLALAAAVHVRAQVPRIAVHTLVVTMHV